MKSAANASNKRTKLIALLEPAEWAVGLGEGAALVALDPEFVDKVPP